VGLATFACSQFSLRLTGRLAVLFWVLTCVAVLPATLMAYRLDLHHASWLPASARHRVIIWNFTAEKLFDSPWFGIGANMTYVLGPELDRQTPKSSDGALGRTLSIHSHNIYLQTWFELGLFGAALLTLVGLSILSAIRGLIPLVQPYAYATFASAAAMAAASYGMWQMWFMASFGLTAVLFWVGASLLNRNATDETGLSTPIGAQRAG
jgi:O-antigen ligase